MFVHLLLTNVFRIDHTPNDRAQRVQLDSGVAQNALTPSVKSHTPFRQAGLPLDGTSSDIHEQSGFAVFRLNWIYSSLKEVKW